MAEGGGIYLNTPSTTTGLASVFEPDFQIKQQALAQSRAFQDGLPTDDAGNIDYTAAAKKLLQLGAYAPAKDMIGIGLQQQGMKLGMQAGQDLANGGITPAPGSGSAPAAPGVMPVFQKAIAGIESGGNYGAQGPATKSGDVALGKYQVMASNVPQWTQEILGKSMTPEEFLASPEAQDAVFNGKFGQYLKQTGNPRDAASMWFTGAPYAQGAQRADQLGTTGQAYTDKFMAGLPRIGAQSSDQPLPAPIAPGGRVAQTSTGQPVQTDAHGRALDPATGAPTQVAPTQVAGPGAPTGNSPAASSGDSDAPSSVHPFGPGGPAASPAARPAVAPVAQPQTPPQTVSQPLQPAPVTAPPQAPQSAGAAFAIDPTMGGLVPKPWIGNPGGYVNALRGRAVQLSAVGQDKPAAAYSKQADMIENAVARSNITTPEMKNYEIARQQGYQGSMMDFSRDLSAQQEVARITAQNSPDAISGAAQKAGAVAGAEGAAHAQTDLVATQPTPGGPVQYVPKAQILAATQPVVKDQPGFVAERQGALAKKEGEMLDQLQQRQIAKERIGAMTNLLETFQSGAGADQKASAVAAARAVGFNLPDSATANPAAVEQFSKNTTANIFSQAKALGGKVLVSELAGLQKSNANPNMQPASNGAILAQQKGLLDWQDAHDQAYFDWKRVNPNAYDPSSFEQEWTKANPVSGYVAAAKKDIAPLGAPLPPKNQLVDGQAYMIKGQKAKWSAAANGFVPVATSQ